MDRANQRACSRRSSIRPRQPRSSSSRSNGVRMRHPWPLGAGFELEYQVVTVRTAGLARSFQEIAMRALRNGLPTPDQVSRAMQQEHGLRTVFIDRRDRAEQYRAALETEALARGVGDGRWIALAALDGATIATTLEGTTRRLLVAEGAERKPAVICCGARWAARWGISIFSPRRAATAVSVSWKYGTAPASTARPGRSMVHPWYGCPSRRYCRPVRPKSWMPRHSLHSRCCRAPRCCRGSCPFPRLRQSRSARMSGRPSEPLRRRLHSIRCPSLMPKEPRHVQLPGPRAGRGPVDTPARAPSLHRDRCVQPRRFSVRVGGLKFGGGEGEAESGGGHSTESRLALVRREVRALIGRQHACTTAACRSSQLMASAFFDTPSGRGPAGPSSTHTSGRRFFHISLHARSRSHREIPAGGCR